MIETSRRTWRVLEPYHGMIYFAPEAVAAYGELGLRGRAGYFASRSAALGAVPAPVVVATFYNFNPVLVEESIAGAWSVTDPAAVVAARYAAADQALRATLGDAITAPGMRRAADLLRAAAETVAGDVTGRPLFAAHAALPWPAEPHLVLWHAQTLLREYRGDAHVAALLTAGLSGIEALVTHAASGAVPAETLRTSRAWSTADWSEAVTGLRERNWLTGDADLTFTPDGAARRAEIEKATDENSVAPYAHIGESACTELQDLVRPFSRALAEKLMPWALARQ
ncbi:SCO6745 family protein [Amycolatopsis kentuckyensis]|uniref:SCO6745 family protein n=1 Tax=Amycolatopsis kentuckyensis TaxID=218823 RepID=UPI003563D998